MHICPASYAMEVDYLCILTRYNKPGGFISYALLRGIIKPGHSFPMHFYTVQ
jgi:hypothetical protein